MPMRDSVSSRLMEIYAMANAHNFFIEIRSVVGVTFVIANRLAVSAVLIMFIYNILINL